MRRKYNVRRNSVGRGQVGWDGEKSETRVRTLHVVRTFLSGPCTVSNLVGTVRTRQLEYFDIFPSFDIPWPAEILSFDLEYSILIY